MRSSRRWTLKRVLSWTVTIVLVVGWFVFLRPSALGGPAGYVTVSGESMEPTMYDGDFVITRERSDYEVGDVLVYRIEEEEVGAGGLVIHRVIGGSIEEGFKTQGDNRDQPDLWYPTAKDIVGEVWIEIPRLGQWLPILRSPIVVAAVAALLAFGYVMGSGRKEEETDPPADE